MTDRARLVRAATASDAEACRAIYAPYVLDTAVTFETEPPSVTEMAARISRAHLWLVAEDDGEVVGYAYAGEHRSRPAYRWTCETSVYVAAGHHRQGIARTLYEALLPALATRGLRLALAGVALPHEASLRLHRSVGFRDVGVFTKVGWKAGAWHDVAWLQLDLAPGSWSSPGL